VSGSPGVVPHPGRLEVAVTRVMLHGIMSGAYRSWIAGLGLRGAEGSASLMGPYYSGVWQRPAAPSAVSSPAAAV
jgi:hypothetical protein